MSPNRHYSLRGKHAGSVGPQAHWSAAVSAICRFVVLCAIAYSAWRLGGLESTIQWQLAIGLSIAAGLGLIFVESHATIPRARAGLCAMAVAWLLWGWLQWVPLPAGLVAVISPGVADTRQEFIGETLPVSELASGDSETAQVTWRPISLVPSKSQSCWSLHTLGVASFIIGCTLFATNRARFWLLIGVAGNAGAIAAWSIIQRVSHSSQVLPGTESEVLSSAFSTFRYSNAGAAYLLLGLAAAVGVVVWVLADKRLWQFGQSRSTRGSSAYNHSGYWADLSVVASITLLFLICFAVLLSFSRGAWAAGLVAMIVVATTSLRSVGWRSLVVLVVVAVTLIAGGTLLVSQHDRLESRSEDLTVDQISSDDRYQHWRAGFAAAVHYLPAGSGIGTYGFAYLPFKFRDTNDWYRSAHNQYLEVLTESGLIGILLVLGGVVLLGRQCWSVFRYSDEPSQIAIGAAGGFALISVVCQGVFDFVITYPPNMLTAGLLLGAVCGSPGPSGSQFTAVRGPRFLSSATCWLVVMMIPLLSA